MTHFDEIKNMPLEEFAELLAFLVVGVDDIGALNKAKENYIEYLQSEVQQLE